MKHTRCRLGHIKRRYETQWTAAAATVEAAAWKHCGRIRAAWFIRYAPHWSCWLAGSQQPPTGRLTARGRAITEETRYVLLEYYIIIVILSTIPGGETLSLGFFFYAWKQCTTFHTYLTMFHTDLIAVLPHTEPISVILYNFRTITTKSLIL